MAYIGQQPVVGRYILLDQISGGFNGTTSGFTMSTAGGVQGVKPGLAQNVLLSLGGVIQQPGVDYTISGSGITFTTPPVSGTTFFATVLGDAQSVGTPSDGTVTPASIAAGFDFAFPNVNVTGVTTIASGVAATPSLSITGDADTGIFSPAANTIAVTTSGTEHLRIDSSGRLLVGTETNRLVDGSSGAATTNQIQVESTGEETGLTIFSNGTLALRGSSLNLGRSRGTSLGSNTIVEGGDTLGAIVFNGADGTDARTPAAQIVAQVHGTPGSDDMPGRLMFETTADGASSPTERMRIDNAGRLLVGTTSARAHLNDGNDSTQIALEGTTQNTTTLSVVRNSDNDGPAHLVLGKSRGGSANSTTVLQSGDTIGQINFEGADGTHLIRAAQISCRVDGTPGANDMPGRLVFLTTADSGTSATERMRISSDGTVAITDNLTVNDNQYPTAGALSHRNMILNGDMRIDQRNGGSSTTPTADATYVFDRWMIRNAGGSGRFSVEQSGTSPNNIDPSLLLTVTTTAAPGASEFYGVEQRVEGYITAPSAIGSADAKALTLSFYVRSSLTGTYCCSFRNAAADRSFVAEYSISAADTWEFKTIQIAAKTDGTWNTTNNIGAYVDWVLGAGSNFEGSTGWQSANRVATSNQVDWINTSGATFHLTGVQLELGEKATPFEYKSYGDELARCQRYCFKYAPSNQEWIYNESNASNQKWWHFYYPPMRDTPSFDAGTLSTGTGTSVNGLSGTISTLAAGGSFGSGASGRQSIRVTMSATGGTAYNIHHTDSWAGDHCFCFSEL